MPQTTEQHFRSVAPTYMRLLLTDFPELGPEDAAAIFGNAGHESKGLTDDQEDKPVVKGSRGVRLEAVVEALRTRFGRVE